MEFEQNTVTSDEDRQLAETKRIILQPLHSDIHPEPADENSTLVTPASEGTIANVSGDIEQEALLVQPSASLIHTQMPLTTQKSQTFLYIMTAIGLVLFVLVILFIIFEH